MPQRRPGSLRERNRAARNRAFLDAARWIVALEGEDGLTMQRLADELQCGVGSIYRYFPNKHALLAAVRGEQLDELRAAFLASQATLDDAIAGEGMAAPKAALARVVAAARFWIGARRTFRQQLQLVRRLYGAPGPARDAVLGVVVDPVRAVLDAAVDGGALDPGDGDGDGRTAVLISTVGDVADVGAGDDRLVTQLLVCLLVVWGADPDQLDDVVALVARAEEELTPT